MKFMLGAAAQERARWGGMLPHPDQSALVSGSMWSNLGPTSANALKNGSTTLHVTDSGRVRSIIASASTLYVATAGGGVWRSSNGGGSWTPLTESLGSLSVGSLAIDPTNAATLYLGLGDPFDGTGVGLVKSTDGGNTWSAPAFLGDSTIIPQLLVAPAAPNVVLAATNRGLYRSADAGSSWSLVSIATGQSDVPYVWTIASSGGHASCWDSRRCRAP
jgi:hypothetical protein